MTIARSCLCAGGAFLLVATTVMAAAPVPRPTTSTSASHPATQFLRPYGAALLYDQSGTEVANVVAQVFGDMPTYSSYLADDFVVTDASGWTVSTVISEQNTTLATNFSVVRFDVDFFADDAGHPAAIAECSSVGLTPTFDVTNTVATIVLDDTCYLSAGTWWVSATPAFDFAAGGQMYASLGDTNTQILANPVWRNPGGGWGGACTDWTVLSDCADITATISPTATMLFQLIGHAGGQTDRIRLTVGVAEDNGDPDQCGTASALSATVGDALNICYTMQNQTPYALNYQTLVDSVDGVVLGFVPVTIESGATYQYNRLIDASASQSRSTTWTTVDALPGYVNVAGTYNFVDISTTGTDLGLGDDDSASITMPFSFTFGDATSDVVCVSNNGILVFGAANGCDGVFSNRPLPTGSISLPALMPFWTDLCAAGVDYYQTLGVAPDRRFVVDYVAKTRCSGSEATPGYTFEVILNEADGSIDFNYATVTVDGDASGSDGGASTVGLQMFTPAVGNQYSYDTASLSDGQNIHWSAAPTPHTYMATQTITLDVGAPVVAAIPGTLTGTADVGETVVALLYLQNWGNRDLVWSFVEAPGVAAAGAAAHAYVVPGYAGAVADAGLVKRSARAGRARVPAMRPSDAAAVPSVGMAYYAEGNQLVGFDAAVGGALTEISAVGETYYAATFRDFDFTTEYAIVAASGDLYTIDTSDGTRALIGNTGLPAGITASSMRWDPTSGITYLMGTFCDGSPATTSNLYTIDLATAATTLVANDVATQSCSLAIAIDPSSGQLYALDVRFDILHAIDKTTGQATNGGVLGFDANNAQGMDFDATTGVLYLAGFDGSNASMYAVDVSNTAGFGNASLIGPLGDGIEVAAFLTMTLLPPCQRVEDIPWLTAATMSGTTAAHEYSTVDVTLDALNLVAGDYSATLCMHTNDPGNHDFTVPVAFTVTGEASGDAIFADGFDD